MTPEEIAHSERYDARSDWHRDQRVLKLRWGTVRRWLELAKRLNMPKEDVTSRLLGLYFELSLERRSWVSSQALAGLLVPGATAHMVALELAENRNGQVVFLDVERTVNESKMRRDVGLRALPAKRARDLEGQLDKVHVALRAVSMPVNEANAGTIQVLRARAADRTILARWKNALLSRFPHIETLQDLNAHWERFA